MAYSMEIKGTRWQGPDAPRQSMGCPGPLNGNPNSEGAHARFAPGEIAAMSPTSIARPVSSGLVASLLLLAVYFAVVTLLSGWPLAAQQFAEFWPFVLPLAAGFGMQIGLYTRLRSIARHGDGPRRVVAVSGGTSAAAMVSCCTHYVANVIPVLGATGALALVAQYQTELFWVGLMLNAAGVAYVGRKLAQASRHMAEMRRQP